MTNHIIIGVDQENDFQFSDVSKDSNRKNTQNVVDMLKGKKFAGSVRPTVYVQPISFFEGSIDVIVIKNSNNTPYYLTERAEGYGVHPNNIYTRIQDTNTAINSSADLDKIEYLWRKRFGLTKTPFDRLEIYLGEPENWVNSPQGEMHKYYKYFPEFTIDYRNDGDDRKGYQYYLFSQMNHSSRWHDIIIKYHQTILTEIEGVTLDSGRYFTPVPELDGISLSDRGSWDITLRYYIKNSFLYKLNHFFFKNEFSSEAKYARERFMKVILLFKSIREKEEFKQYVIDNENDIEKYSSEVHLPYIPEKLEGYIDNAFDEDYRNALIMQKMLIDFRNN